MGLGLEEEASAKEGAPGDNNHAAALSSTLVDDSLQFLGLHAICIAVYAVVGYHVAF